MTMFTLADHLVPVIITLFLILLLIIFLVAKPYLKYILLVSNAGEETGEEKLAQHLANETGGKKIDTSDTWEEFRPAAKFLHRVHVDKKESLSK